MKLLSTSKDGGNKSRVWAHWLIELKSLFSVVALRFEDGTREAFHDHAFNCFSWVVKGELNEEFLGGRKRVHRASWKPFRTYKRDFHKVSSKGRTWVLSFRGPWQKTWREVDEEGNLIVLTNGRREVHSMPLRDYTLPL